MPGHALSRRTVLRNMMLGGAATALPTSRLFALAGAGADLQLTPGRFQGTQASLEHYRMPAWFADAKFGMWAHWGPQSGVEDGDWYARNMYIQGTDQYRYHCETFGHPTKVGYKDLIPQFRGDRWDPDHLIDLYVNAGAKYFFSMGVHHDNFDMWNSKYQPRWNAVATGPKKDIVGMWRMAARKRGLYFGVSEHLSNSFDWLLPAHLSDTTGPLAGVPYDGANPAYSDLYHDYAGEPKSFFDVKTTEAMGRNAPDRWKQQYFNRVRDLIDQHQPDLLYTDGGIPFGEYGLSTVAELYNVSEAYNKGRNNAVYFSKTPSEPASGICALDRERGVLDGISPVAWQTDTCIGDWHYKRGTRYKNGKKVIDLLVDIVSKNGNLLLNIPLPNSGEPDYLELVTIAEITAWMKLNSEGIYATRPWTIYGEGPATRVVIKPNGQEFDPNEGKKPDLGADDIRFTTKGESILFAYAMGWPEDEFFIQALGTASPQKPKKIANVTLLGSDRKLQWTQAPDGLRITKPAEPLSPIGHGFKIVFA
jgi:alpha-L-fucosidase